ncbi:transposase domain-containing protein [Dyella nitratireducens]|uniref:transposase domain-containing protein n=2 Tax=Dyella nitratireducens TaxID=1849580 RepID=UPI00166C59DD|nr:transposase domain-containing protein [Dyella nitratireducens]
MQSLLMTCRLQAINSYTYLVDVLQCIDRHPARVDVFRRASFYAPQLGAETAESVKPSL